MERWQLAAVASESTPDQCVPQTRQMARFGSQVLDVRLGCNVCLVFFINGIGVATVCCLDGGFSFTVVYDFVRSSENNY